MYNLKNKYLNIVKFGNKYANLPLSFDKKQF